MNQTLINFYFSTLMLKLLFCQAIINFPFFSYVFQIAIAPKWPIGFSYPFSLLNLHRPHVAIPNSISFVQQIYNFLCCFVRKRVFRKVLFIKFLRLRELIQLSFLISSLLGKVEILRGISTHSKHSFFMHPIFTIFTYATNKAIKQKDERNWRKQRYQAVIHE